MELTTFVIIKLFIGTDFCLWSPERRRVILRHHNYKFGANFVTNLFRPSLKPNFNVIWTVAKILAVNLVPQRKRFRKIRSKM